MTATKNARLLYRFMIPKPGASRIDNFPPSGLSPRWGQNEARLEIKKKDYREHICFVCIYVSITYTSTYSYIYMYIHI